MRPISNAGRLVLAAFDEAGVAVFDLQQQAWLSNRKELHAGLMGTQSLAVVDGFALAAGSDGLVIWDIQDPSIEGSMNLLANGDWFSIARDAQGQRVDGVPEGIDHVVNAQAFYHPGSVWEQLRERGGFGAMLLHK